MAHSISAEKRIRQNSKRNARNRARRTVLKNTLRKTGTAVASGDASKAATAISSAIQLIDRESKRPTLHKNAAARRKSKLMKKLNALKAGKK